MPLIIALRRDANTNFFRDVLVGSLGSGKVDDALLCSGFFQENFKNSAYQASLELDLAKVCAKSKVKLTTVGIHNGTWKAAYRNFKANMQSAGVDINCLYKNGLAWHAKVFVATSRGKPVLGVIGSSNITRNAFSTGGRFNNECDVYLLPPRSPLTAVVEESIGTDQPNSIIRAPYRPAENGGLTINQRLNDLKAEILEQELVAL